MPACFKLQHTNSLFHVPFVNRFSLTNKFTSLPKFHALISPMLTESKRSICPSCSKPATLCLCSRLPTPTLHNSVAVTIFQHTLEKKHPLNSTRIARIGLKNLDVVTVSDVNFEARFSIRLFGSTWGGGMVESDESCHLLDELPTKEKDDQFLIKTSSGSEGGGADDNDLDGAIFERNEFNGAEKRRKLYQDAPHFSDINFTIAKYGTIRSFSHSNPDIFQQMSFDELLASGAAVDDIRKGFIVKKFQMKRLDGMNECEESEEFEVAVPPGSVLLFPSEGSVDVETVNFEVKNLIVLDGTWAKAKRMYKENPWLRVLPHIRLNIDKLSLYREVRHEPRAGYLSTIESVVYAMKAVGEDADGLDGLLKVFDSMVGDQRRCKNERLSKLSEE